MVTKQAIKDAFLYQDISTWITQPCKEIVKKKSVSFPAINNKVVIL